MAQPPSSRDTRTPDARSESLAALTDLGQALADASSPAAVADRVAETLDRLLHPDHLVIVLGAAPGERAIAHARGAPTPDPDDPLIDRALDHGPEVIPRNVRATVGPSLPAAGAPASWIGAPLGRRPLGALSLGSRTAGRFRKADLPVVAAVAALAGVALERARLLDQVTRAKREWERTVDAIGPAFCIVDAAGCVRRANRAFGDLAGVPLKELPGRPVLGVLGPAWTAALDRLLAEPDGPAGVEVRAEDRVYAVTALPLGPEAPADRVLVLDDQTDRRRLQEQLVQSEKMSAIGQLIAGVAHDLNNPLASVIGFSEYLLERDDNVPAHLEEPLRAIRLEAGRAAAIVHNLLGFARKHDQERRAVPVRDLVDSTLLLLRNQLLASKVTATVDVAPDLPDVEVVVNQLQQVFVNLINNAVQALEPGGGGRIAVSARPWLDGVAVTIEDDGPGVPADLAERIFEPFFTTKPEGEGTGLGLSICHGIVKEHDGRLAFEAAGDGGARFRVELPPARVPAHVTGEQPALRPGLHILVVDDELHIRHYLQATLEAWGHRVALAADGAEALAQTAAAPFDVVITDLRMPGVGGRELFETLAVRQPELARCVVFATGDTVRGDTLAFLESLDRPYLRKPFTLKELRAALARAAPRP